MAIRYYSQFTDQQGTLFTLNIYDDQYSGTSPFEFTVGSDGFRLDYEIEDKFAPICPSTVTVPMLLRNNNDAALLTNLVNSDEGRYVLEIRSGGTTYANGHIFWRGIVLPEFIEVVDEAYPQLVELKAMDDLSNLPGGHGLRLHQGPPCQRAELGAHVEHHRRHRPFPVCGFHRGACR
jgi:hypothetical protein